MILPIQLISTDFDGTLFAEFEFPPIPPILLDLIGKLQARGAKWVINTGRDMSSLMEALARCHVPVKPDYLVLVEREIHARQESRYVGLDDWNLECHRAHEELFRRVRQDLPRLVGWVTSRYNATVYEDAYSPFCLLAGNNAEANVIHGYMEQYCAEIPNLQVVRNDVYARFAHARYNKGSALAEIARRLEILPEHTFAAGDHLNDLPMLNTRYARLLAAPSNAIEPVKDAVRNQGGFVSDLPHGHGIAQALDIFWKNEALPPS
jgi:hydroxymethylpyrimidine pyrophosphatase-like HAD family hydrolase